MRRLLLAVAVMALALAFEGVAMACPGCKEATSEQGQNLARGFSYSILLMMPIPFIIVGSFGGYAYYVTRQREANARDAEQSNARPSQERG